jgi:hypothetical protein
MLCFAIWIYDNGGHGQSFEPSNQTRRIPSVQRIIGGQGNVLRPHHAREGNLPIADRGSAMATTL